MIELIYLSIPLSIMSILITGVAGFIGINFLEYYFNTYPEEQIIGLDKFTYAADKKGLKKIMIENKDRLEFIKGDLQNFELLDYIFTKYDIKSVVNFAAETHVDNSIEEPKIFAETNILGVLNLLTVAKKYWLINQKWLEGARFVQISTDEVYGSLERVGLFTEDSPLDPHSPYSASKASGDLMVKAFVDTYEFPGMITRCSNNYGSHQHLEKLIPKIISRAINHQPIPIYGDGKQIRDWLYVQDHCKAIDMVHKNGTLGDIYNIGGNNEWNNISLTKKLLQILSQKLDDPMINETLIEHVSDRLGHDRRYGIDSTKIRNKLGWQAETSFDVGLNQTVDWYLKKFDDKPPH